MTLPASQESELVARLRAGDAAAFDRVYALYQPRLYSFLARLSGRRDVAEDLAQDTWMRFARAAPGLREDSTLGPYLFTMARNAFTSHRRWAMLDLSRLFAFGVDALASGEAVTTPDVEHERARSLAQLEQGLQALPVASREVLLLVGVEGLEQEEVARVLDISYDALRQRLSRARAQLTEALMRLEKHDRPKKVLA